MSSERFNYFDGLYQVRHLNSVTDNENMIFFGVLGIRPSLIEECERIFKKVNEVSRTLESEGHDSIEIAMALIMQSLSMTLTSTNEKECKHFAKFLKSEAENFDNLASSYFKDRENNL